MVHSRRRFICITAAAALDLLQPGARAAAAPVTWRGIALGAVASMQIHHPDRAAAERLVARSVQEVRRLERLFSLYREDSSLVALNRRGILEAPPPELVALLAEARRYAELTDGAFDATVQPLWNLYAAHFGRPDAEPAGPAEAAIDAARANIGFDKVLVSRDRIALSRHGMALTLNGIAQGYVTDRIVALLRSEGVDHSLVNMGEARALGARPDGSPWQIGLADPDRPERIAETLPVADQAVATSAGSGFRFDPAGRFTHLFDPRTGRSPHRHRSVTVVVPTATAADALSTAFSCMAADDIGAVLRSLGQGRAHLTSAEGRPLVLES